MINFEDTYFIIQFCYLNNFYKNQIMVQNTTSFTEVVPTQPLMLLSQMLLTVTIWTLMRRVSFEFLMMFTWLELIDTKKIKDYKITSRSRLPTNES